MIPQKYNSTPTPYWTNQTILAVPYSVEIIRQLCIGVWANIVVVGLFGNILTVIILAGPKLNTTSTTFYLTVLAIIDLLYLIFSLGGQMFDFALLFPKTMRQENEVACKLLNIIRYSLAYISVWLLVAVSIDRMIWVLLPFRAKLICTRKMAKIVVTSFCIFFIGIDIHFIWTVKFIRENSINHCVIINNPLFKYIFPYVDLTLIMFLPFVIMSISNVLIVMKMRKVSQVRQMLHRPSAVSESYQSDYVKVKTHSLSPPLAINDDEVLNESTSRLRSFSQIKFCNRRASKFTTKDKQTSSLTRMLLSVNIFFIASTSPLLVYDIVYYVVDIKGLVDKMGNYLGGIIFGIERFVYTLWYLNFSVHFLLYCLSGPRFRDEAKSFIRQYLFRKRASRQTNNISHKPFHNVQNNAHADNNIRQRVHSSLLQKPAVKSNYMKSKSFDVSIPEYRSVYRCIRETQI